VDLFLQYLFSSFMWQGALIAVQIAVVAFVAALLLGLLLALMRESRHAWLRYPANFYVWFMRGTPLLLQLVFLYTCCRGGPAARLRRDGHARLRPERGGLLR
jgi:polar amino acid transport system permease protein